MKEEKEKLDNVIKNGAQFPYTSPCHAEIKLTKTGKRLFEKKYLNRPTPYEIKDDIYYFSCSFDQLVLYFFGFGKEATIISPLFLKDKLKKQFYDAYCSYETKEITN